MLCPKVTIIILNWNGKKNTIECLESLKQITYPNYEILLVDNGSTDGSVEYFRGIYPNIELIENGKNLGFAEGNNVGIKKAMEKMSDYVLLLNNDTKVEKKFLSKLILAVENDKTIFIAQSKIFNFDNEIDNIGMVCDKFGYTVGRKSSTQQNDLFYLSGACLLIRTKLYGDELFDGKLFAYHEDVDLGWQTQLQNRKMICVHDSICFHKGSAVLGSSPKKAYFMWRNRLRVMIKNYSFISLLKYLPSAVILELSMSLLYSLRHRNLMYVFMFFKGILWNIYNLRGTLNRRKIIQSTRKLDDSQILRNMISYSLELQSIKNYLKQYFL